MRVRCPVAETRPKPASEKPVHLSMHGGGFFAPCGARVGVHAATFDPGKGFTYSTTRETELKDLQSSAVDVEKVTCPECQRAALDLVKRYQRAKRAKKVTW